MAKPRPNVRLSDDEIAAISERLRKGEFLDDHWRHQLFREAKEAELTYAEKQNRSMVLADTMAVPLQTLKRFGVDSTNGWTNKLVFGDNLQVLKTLLEMKERGELLNADGAPGVRLCYIDPPFTTKQDKSGRRGEKAYKDKVAGTKFLEFLRRRLIFIYELLSQDGALYLHLDTRVVHYAKALLDELFGSHTFRAEVIWKRTNARSAGNAWPRLHDTLLVYAKSSQFVYQPLSIAADDQKLPHTLVTGPDGQKYQSYELTAPGETKNGPSGRPWRDVVLPPGRHWGNSHSILDEWDAQGLIHWPKDGGFPRRRADTPFDPSSRTVVVGDVWTDIDRINQSAQERTGYPTQKPEALLDRIISASSSEGDLVLDCFAGSGTSAVVAERLARRWIAVDCGKFSIYTAQRRLLALADESDQDAATPDHQPFELCSAGLYDNQLVDKLSFDGFQQFCLDLFGCHERSHAIGGVRMAGTRKGDPVHFFPFQDAKDMEMGRDYIESLHKRLKGKVTGSAYIVVPVAACDPGLFEDVVTIEKVTFFILRVPYSVIEVLHGRRFKLPDQPVSEELVNDPMDTFGFDFMQLPEADVRYVTNRGKFYGVVRSFMRGGLDPDDFKGLEEKGRFDLAMVMIDCNYDGETFNVSNYFFGDEIEEEGWTFSLPIEDLDERILVIYLDTHGNELRETVEVAKVKAGSKPRTPSRKKKDAPAPDLGEELLEVGA